MTRENSVRLGIACLCCAMAGSAAAQLSDSEIDALIREGAQQIEREEFAAARTSLETVLEQEPDHVIAIYELALAYFRAGEYSTGLAVLDDVFGRGLETGAEHYSLAASMLDNLGRTEEAVKRFEEGIAAFPDNHNLSLNFGVTQLRMGQTAAAKATFERTIMLQPEHPSAHFFLGQIYAAEGQTAAAVFALGTSLGFDSNGQRMAAAAGTIKNIMDSGLRLTEGGKPIVVLPVDALAPVETIEVFASTLPMHFATAYTIQQKADGDMSYEPYAIAYGLIATALVRAGIDPESHFVARQYFDFYQPMVENGHADTFAHLILAPLNPAVAVEWMQANREKMETFRNWTQSR